MATLKKEFQGKALRIVTQCNLTAFRCGNQQDAGEPVHCETVLWDTGASVSVISSRIASELKLVPTGISYVSGFDGKKQKTNTYRINLEFNDSMQVKFVEVVESPMVFFDMLIGMDIIMLGDLSIKNRGADGTEFSFTLD